MDHLRSLLSILVPTLVLAFATLPAPLTAQFRETVEIEPGERCPTGMTEIRPQRCMAPEFEPPFITDYHPRSMLVTEETATPRAKFPVVDVHGHTRGFAGGVSTLNEMIGHLDDLNIQVYISADNVTGDRLRQALDAIEASPHSERFRVMAGIEFDGVGTPGWAERAARQLDEDLSAGAVALGEVSKSFGMTLRKADGSRLRVDDPELDPIWETVARHDVPAFIHTAEPPAFFEPLDLENERWLELALFPNRRKYGPDNVSFEQLMEERNNLFRRHPETTFIAAHFGWHGNDLERAGALLDEFPNVYYEVGAVLYEFGRQPRAAREFFIEYQDRILFGKDSFQPSEYPYFYRVFETTDEYFDYYRDYHAFWKMYGMNLPDDVLRKLYYENALRLMDGLPREGFPE
ncbi:MAG: amidohydrolase family protein [Gemmatimonadota bacterium]|nr:amidohydrolase family protein [Gemmatimonadota bacterium]